MNSLQQTQQRPTFTSLITSEGYTRLIYGTIKDKAKAGRFVTAITSAVTNTPALQECDGSTIVSAALLGESLNLSPSPQLGQYYLVPYKDRKNGRTVAQFNIGYKGLIQLAIRSGQYKKLNVLPIKQGELIRFDPLNEEIEVNLIQDEQIREQTPTMGYYAMFEYTNGFRKALYWSRAKMESHAEKYSAGYKAKKGFTFWEKNFDSMACKTMLRQLIGKWGVMSIEMQEAYIKDQAVINGDGSYEYIDNQSDNTPQILTQPEPIQPETVTDEDEFVNIMEA